MSSGAVTPAALQVDCEAFMVVVPPNWIVLAMMMVQVVFALP